MVGIRFLPQEAAALPLASHAAAADIVSRPLPMRSIVEPLAVVLDAGFPCVDAIAAELAIEKMPAIVIAVSEPQTPFARPCSLEPVAVVSVPICPSERPTAVEISVAKLADVALSGRVPVVTANATLLAVIPFAARTLNELSTNKQLQNSTTLGPLPCAVAIPGDDGLRSVFRVPNLALGALVDQVTSLCKGNRHRYHKQQSGEEQR